MCIAGWWTVSRICSHVVSQEVLRFSVPSVCLSTVQVQVYLPSLFMTDWLLTYMWRSAPLANEKGREATGSFAFKATGTQTAGLLGWWIFTLCYRLWLCVCHSEACPPNCPSPRYRNQALSLLLLSPQFGPQELLVVTQVFLQWGHFLNKHFDKSRSSWYMHTQIHSRTAAVVHFSQEKL